MNNIIEHIESDAWEIYDKPLKDMIKSYENRLLSISNGDKNVVKFTESDIDREMYNQLLYLRRAPLRALREMQLEHINNNSLVETIEVFVKKVGKKLGILKE